MSLGVSVPHERGGAPVAADQAQPVKVRASTAQDAQAWDRCIESHGGSFYHLYGWREINAKELGHETFYLIAERGDRIVGALPLVLVSSRLFGRILCSMPFVNFGGPCGADPAVDAALLKAAADCANSNRVDYLELRCMSQLETTIPVSLRKISMTVPLDPNPEVLWNGFTSKHRKNVKRVQKFDLQVKSGGIELLPQFYSLMELSWHALGTPLYRRSYFERVLQTFPTRARIYMCYHGDVPVATGLTGDSGDTLEGLWAAADPQRSRELQPNYVLYWEMIRDACLRGFRQFHLGRSTADSGAEQFKSRWNAERKQLYWYFHRPDGGPMPELNVDNPKYRMAIAAWRRMPLAMVRMMGPRLARLIP